MTPRPPKNDDRPAAAGPWLQALVWFGAGDLVTSAVGVSTGLAREAVPVIAGLIANYGVLAMVGSKVVALGVAYGLWRLAPAPYAIVVPLGLAALGLFLTVWNLYVLGTAVLPL